ncbi:hypothetical protein SAMN04488118_110148 [Epibacterium ulvae]|uniref:Lipoprotein n=1 Tax=Epibacterium ulvae TaxID=1156985 RepID=A0A1G5R906_9RHOB|nr:hypothetical protein [Epibacterium ulvae]SCZ70537.1 hypothetical protein SAMN04488118_110148 [Epibacterium ulvae]
MLRILSVLACLAFVSACTPASPDDPLQDLGNFSLGHNVVVAPNVQVVPGSKEVSTEQWINVLKNEIDARFGQYEGDQLYHFGISIEGFFVAPGGVPLVLSPKSVLAINVTVWDDAAGAKLNSEVETFTVFETADAGSVFVGAGHTRTVDEQVLGLARNAVRKIEAWMVEQNAAEGWFAAATTTDSLPPSEGVPNLLARPAPADLIEKPIENPVELTPQT